MKEKPYSVNIEYLPEINSTSDTISFNNYIAASKFFAMMITDETVARVYIIDNERETWRTVAEWINVIEFEIDSGEPITPASAP